LVFQQLRARANHLFCDDGGQAAHIPSMSDIQHQAQSQARTVTTPVEAICISALCFGWFIFASITAVRAGYRAGGSFSDEGFISLIAFELVVGTVALYVLRVRGFSVASLYPVPSMSGAGVGVLLYIATVFVAWLVTAPFTSAAYNAPIERLMPEKGGVELATLVALGIVNGAYEEVFLLGFLLRGLRGYGLAVALGVSLLVRLLYHLYQGPVGALSVFAFGGVLSLYFASSGRLFPAVLAHALGDIVPFIGRW
jgi:membrane protease YdiL (CAAX protease family)